ncbi:MAG: ABC transporter ATP-binding protein [Lachnospiraceae bacterium]|nr:ABC transporter ATP-binding protein [Lachnospiraceae bacterium]
MNVLNVNKLVKQFGDFRALNEISFQIGKGEVFGFIGPNGAGKTTTIRTLLGVYKATSGYASIFGKDVWKQAEEIHKKLAYVPGDVNLWNNLTGGEVIDFFLRLNGKQNDLKKKELIERFDFDPKKKCRTYSKGNRQKVALVAAFASDADFLILDEPTSGLDPLMESVFQECVAESKEKGKSVLLSSHILSEVERLCDKVGIIKHGKIIETGTLDKLRHLTRTNVEIMASVSATQIEKIIGVHCVEQKDRLIKFQVDSEKIGEIMKQVSAFNIEKIEVTPMALEDLFMHYYNENGDDINVKKSL